jgi:tRNA (guanine-N7-)-methyltransferase
VRASLLVPPSSSHPYAAPVMGEAVVRTFKPRRRRLSDTRAARVAPLLDRWGLAVHGTLLDLPGEFGRAGPFVVEIGFGAGEGLIALAASRPEECVIGVDVHTSGLAAVVDAVDSRGWTHVRVVDGDALEFIRRLAPGALDEVRVFFPDPWPKARQRRRRLVQAEVVGALTDRLRVGAILRLSTDIADYAAQMAEVCAAEPRLRGGVVARPAWRPVTRYERRGLDAGRTVVDLEYVVV